MTDHYFEQIRRLQQMAVQMMRPYKQAELLMNTNLATAIEQVNLIQHLLEPALRFIEHQESIIKAMKLTYYESIHLQLQKIQEITEQMTRIQGFNLNLSIPSTIYPKLEQLLDVVREVTPLEDHSDLVGSITVLSPDIPEAKKKPINWAQLFVILISVLQLLSCIQSGIQLEKFHREHIEQIEIHHQEKMAQDERHHREIIEQKERHHQELLEQNERHHYEKMLLLCQELITECEEYFQITDSAESVQNSSDTAQAKLPDED